ncbi:MAG TPA: hypothetical protein VML75_09480 [Kofleriaceae bacterium]|nr:hypothetical protein [Kofleriaceae bacterium]
MTMGTLGSVLRVAVVGLLAVRLVLADTSHSGWVVGPLAAMVVGALVAVAVVTEPRAWVRRVALAAIAVGYAAWMLRDGQWHTEWFWVRLGLFTLVEAALLAPFLETRLWRWSLVPGMVLFVWLLYHLIPSYGGEALMRRIAWLTQALLLLAASGGRRAMRAEDEVYRAREPR